MYWSVPGFSDVDYPFLLDQPRDSNVGAKWESGHKNMGLNSFLDMYYASHHRQEIS